MKLWNFEYSKWTVAILVWSQFTVSLALLLITFSNDMASLLHPYHQSVCSYSRCFLVQVRHTVHFSIKFHTKWIIKLFLKFNLFCCLISIISKRIVQFVSVVSLFVHVNLLFDRFLSIATIFGWHCKRQSHNTAIVNFTNDAFFFYDIEHWYSLTWRHFKKYYSNIFIIISTYLL